MNTRLVTFKAHRVNILNLVPCHLVETYNNRWYGPCRGVLDTETNFLNSVSDILEVESKKRFGVGLRYVDWINNTSFLQEMLDAAVLTNRSLFFGTHDLLQLTFLKEFIGKDVLTFSLTYNESSYDELLDDTVRYHIYLMKNNLLDPTEHDIALLESKTHSQLVEIYKATFDQMGMIPKYHSALGDYEIPFADYNNPTRMSKHFCNLGFLPVDKVHSFYYNWFHCCNKTKK